MLLPDGIQTCPVRTQRASPVVLDSAALDTLPPAPPAQPPAAVAVVSTPALSAPGDISPRGRREEELCATASRPDWLYLGALVVLDVGAIGFGSNGAVKYSDNFFLRYGAPFAIGLTWGATVGGAWLALPKCSPSGVGEAPPEGGVRETWPLALAFALFAGATAPVVNGIAVGDLPVTWSTEEREAHVITAAVAGFAGALLPYLVPPRTWSAARELERLRLGVGPTARGGAAGFIGYALQF
jgi:hypothetical protein